MSTGELICPSTSIEEFSAQSLVTSSVSAPLFNFGANIEGTIFATAILAPIVLDLRVTAVLDTFPQTDSYL